MKDKEIKIGDEVFVIERKLDIVKHKILEVIHGEKEISYKLETQSCGGVNKNDFFLTKSKAEKVKQDFLDSLKFKVGDLLIFKYKEYSRMNSEIGRVVELIYDGAPYKIKTAYKNIYDITDEDVVLKLNNKYIEDFGDLRELNEQFELISKQLNGIASQINKEHERLEKDFKQSFKKEYSWTRINKVPLFKDKFNYHEEDWN